MIDLEKILELESKATPGGFDVDVYQDLIFLDYVRQNIRQICLELKAAREYFSKDSEVRQISLKEGLQAASNAWQDREDLLQKYHEVANGKG